ncbi:DUF4349 domain-containing protein [Paenibacillus thermotolerans]|uniref:DUF4349 domain-containing protein n=1 Tax=Paenibacillus thermotolerans TaxID=3027807 RepID=UPI002367EA0B|nr:MULTISPECIES: DUF4349 domain-containing protein [unclassified Paenibacillus]
MKGRWIKWLAVAALTAVWTAGCSSGSGGRTDSAASESALVADMETAANKAPAAMPEEAAAGGSGFGSGAADGDDSGAAPAASEPRTARMLIYTANLTMEVESYAKAYTEIQNLIHLSGGYIVGFTEETTSFEKTGLFTIKVPADGFNGFLAKLENVPNVQLNRSMKAQDVSEEYVDLDSRLKAKQVVEKRLLDFMERATKSDDLVKFSNELGQVQEDIERMKGRMRYLEQNVAYSTVELRVYEVVNDRATLAGKSAGIPLGEKMSRAVSGSIDVLVAVFEGVMVVLAGFLPIGVAAGIIGAPVYWLWKRRRGRTPDGPPPSLDL